MLTVLVTIAVPLPLLQIDDPGALAGNSSYRGVAGVRKFMKQEIKSISHLYKYAWMFVLVSLLCWSMESHAFDYDDNIGFMKEVPENLKAAYPTCGPFFLDVQWSRANPNPYTTNDEL